MINITIVDDETDDRKALEELLLEAGSQIREDFHIVSFSSGSALFQADTPRPDILFLDIEMPGEDGISIAARLRADDPDLIIVFETNHAQFAIKSYDVQANDYILKPVSQTVLFMKLRRLVDVVSKRKVVSIPVSSKDGTRQYISSDQIYYADVNDHNVTLHTSAGAFPLSTSLTRLEASLAGLSFMRCNNCYLVNLKYVSSVKKDLICIDNSWIRMSRPRKKEFLEALSKYLGGGKVDHA